MNEIDSKPIEEKRVVVPLRSPDRSKKNVEVRLRCYKLASEIFSREQTREVKRLG